MIIQLNGIKEKLLPSFTTNGRNFSFLPVEGTVNSYVGKATCGNAIIFTPRSYLYLADFSDKKIAEKIFPLLWNQKVNFAMQSEYRSEYH